MATHSESESPVPHDSDAEQSLLGAVLLDPAHLEAVRGALTPADFWSPAHREIFRAMLAVSDAGGAVDLVTVCGVLRDANKLEAVGGMAAVSKLIDGAIRLENVSAYAARIQDKSKRRALIRVGLELADKWAHDPGDVEDVLAAASGALDLVRAGDAGGLELRPLRECETDPEPFPLLRRAGDRFGSVLAAGEVCLLSGAGKVGKSTLALQVAMAAAGCRGGPDAWQEVCGLDVRPGPVAVVSFEDDPRRIYDRAVLMGSAIPERLHVVNARGCPLYGVQEGEHLQARPRKLPAWFRLWAQLRKAQVKLLVVDPIGSAFLGNSASVEAARSFIDALRTEAARSECGVLLIAHANKAARREGDAADPGQVSGSAAFSDAARAVLVMAHDRLSMLAGNYSQKFTMDLEPILTGGKRFAGFREADPSGRNAAAGTNGKAAAAGAHTGNPYA